MSSVVHYRIAKVDNLDLFYREAGSPSNPTILLLHGHASSSHTYRDLIPLIADDFHVIAPDYPGFGQSSRPSPKEYQYTFANLAHAIDRLTEVIGLKRFAIYIFDYGAPVGLTIASKHPERIIGIFSQSGNAYEEGLAPAWDPVRKFWADQSPENREPLTHIFSPRGLKECYHYGAEPGSRVSPDGPNLDIYYMSLPDALEIQLDNVLKDYQTNVKTYPQWQAYLRQHKPKFVAVWGNKDPFFSPPGAEAYKRDLPDADVTIVDGGHFLNDSNPQAVAAGIKKLL